jgi:molybdenum cofactor cytidylyltransferase
MVKCAGLLLAAGKSTRMGSLKALLPWEGTSLLEYQLSQLERSKVDQLVVVLGYQASKLLPFVKRTTAQLVWNPDYEQGKATSIKKGVAAIDHNADCIIILSVDQPVSHSLIDVMINEFNQTNRNIIIPIYKNRRGHPILCSTKIRDEIMQINEETFGLKAILQNRSQEIKELKVEEESVLFNFNDEKDYWKGAKK